MKDTNINTDNKNTSSNTLKNSISSKIGEKSPSPSPNKTFHKSSSSFFGSANPRKSTGFFGSSQSKKSWIDDRPAPESLTEFYEIRKNIIFKRINIINNENEFAKFILASQTKANKMIKQEGLFFTPKDVYDWVLELKENIANYFLVINSYLIAKKDLTALHLFLLMDIQNREKIEKIFQQIKKNFRNMSNANRIGKFYPSIIKLFLQILAVIIKFSAKFNKQFLENFYLKRYLLTISVVKNTVINRFISYNPGIENDYKNLGRFFYFDSLFKVSVYHFIRYQSFYVIIDLFNEIIERYNEIDDIVIINAEQILLMKTRYNLALFLYMLDNSQEAIIRLLEANNNLKNIYFFPYTIKKFIPKDNQNKSTATSNNVNIKSIQDKSTISSFNIDESLEKIISTKTKKKRSVSTKVDYDNSFNKKEVYFGLKQKLSSIIYFGENEINYLDSEKNIEIFIRDQIFAEIELIAAEIELNRNNHEKAFQHMNNILNLFSVSISNIKNKLAYTRTFKELERSSLEFNKNTDKYKRDIELTDLNRRRICFILHKIEDDLGLNQNKNYYNYYKSRKSLEEIQDISSSESCSSISKYSAYTDRKGQSMFEFDKERKLIHSCEKFFIFICSLSLYQLKLLNEFQPEQSQIRDELPILFPNQFKDCLTFSQRLALNYLDTMNLSRCVILIDSKKDISPENINYFFFNPKKLNRNNSGGGWAPTGYSQNFLKKIEKKIYKKKTDYSVNNINNISTKLNENKIKYGFNQFNNNNQEKKNLKKKMFIQGQFQKFIEEDEYFNNKIDEIILSDDKIKMNRNKVYQLMNELSAEDKQLIMNDKSYIENFVNQIKKKVKRKSSTHK
mgnify:CR=1 FL=1